MIVRTFDGTTNAVCAFNWLWRDDLDMARHYADKLSTVDRHEARMVALRLAALLATMLPEKVAAAILTPDALVEGVDGFAVDGVHTHLVDGSPLARWVK
jgi:hypothetical protein